MDLLVTSAFLFGFTQGFVIGPVSLFGIKENLSHKHGLWFHMQVIMASFVVDIVYLFLGTIGAATLIEYSIVKLLMWAGAAYMLIHMGINTLRDSKSKISFQHIHRHKLKFYETDFSKAFVLCLLNPMGIVFCLMVVGSLYASYEGPANAFTFATNVNLGGVIAASIVAVAVALIKKVFHPWMLQKVVMAGSLVLFAYGLSFAWKAVSEFKPALTNMASVLGVY